MIVSFTIRSVILQELFANIRGILRFFISQLFYSEAWILYLSFISSNSNKAWVWTEHNLHDLKWMQIFPVKFDVIEHELSGSGSISHVENWKQA